ncbi:hypothetical protein ACWIGI_29330 [Nocardia sp. NPDC055321]
MAPEPRRRRRLHAETPRYSGFAEPRRQRPIDAAAGVSAFTDGL